MTVRLTQYSHGAGCGCKIAPQVLDRILQSQLPINGIVPDPRLLVGNDSRDDAAVFDLGDGTAIVSTTDFFMPIVDDPFDFGRVAATNAISDIYAMGGTPLMAIAILGWPVNILPPEVAGMVIDGARAICSEAGISLAGGHSIDAPEPIFGLAVTGRVALDNLKRNDQAQAGDSLLLTKPLGVGILTTAEKKGILRSQDTYLARDNMVQLNTIGEQLAQVSGVNAITDVTGFGLLGHLLEVCRGSQLLASIEEHSIPLLTDLDYYLDQEAIPGGSGRNFASYGQDLPPLTARQKHIFCDPQTSGGLLVSVAPDAKQEVEQLLSQKQLPVHWIGSLGDKADSLAPWVQVN
ncbi:MAG TPA: selenide, water dikinase SelD [Oceanospirillaceae bacterium]|nr:selenide, water dikinase SelD [Oceanospirillaceae bacterium]